MQNKYDSDSILDATKILIKKARELSGGDPQVAKMALEAASQQIEREVNADVTVCLLHKALKG